MEAAERSIRAVQEYVVRIEEGPEGGAAVCNRQNGAGTGAQESFAHVKHAAALERCVRAAQDARETIANVEAAQNRSYGALLVELLKELKKMIQPGSSLQISDNSGARIVECIKVLGKSSYSSGTLGDFIVVSVKKLKKKGNIKVKKKKSV
jgi:hypothetical protein